MHRWMNIHKKSSTASEARAWMWGRLMLHNQWWSMTSHDKLSSVITERCSLICSLCRTPWMSSQRTRKGPRPVRGLVTSVSLTTGLHGASKTDDNPYIMINDQHVDTWCLTNFQPVMSTEHPSCWIIIFKGAWFIHNAENNGYRSLEN